MQSDQINTATTPEAETNSIRGRRRFLGAGVATTPVILTLVSQPALGVTCFTPSRSLSKNTSLSQSDQIGECTNAQSPGNYKSQSSPGHGGAYSWPIPPNTEFHSKFARGTRAGSDFWVNSYNNSRSMTMLEVLNADNQLDPKQFAFHMIGAYLNLLGGGGSKISPKAMTVDKLLGIWQEWVTKGYFEPTAGVRWYPEDIKSYLLTNGIVK